MIKNLLKRAKPYFHLVFAISFLSLSGSLMILWIATSASLVSARTAAQIGLSFSDTVRKAAPAVVTIYAKRIVKRNKVPKFFEPFFAKDPNFNRKRVERALGSGVIIDKDGFIVTNYHVIKEARELTVSLKDRRQFRAKVIFEDKTSDLAVLRVDPEGKELPYLEFSDSSKIKVGDIVLAIGNPLGVGQTITSGIISALARSQAGIKDAKFFLQTDAATNQGSSGGALVNLEGRLVGINTAIYSKTGGFMGIGFSIPSNMVQLIAQAAIEGGVLRRPWTGAILQDVSGRIAQAAGLDKTGGVLIAQVYPDSPAEEAGLKTGDIILKIDGQETLSKGAMLYHIALAAKKDEVEVVFLRDNKSMTVDLPIRFPPMKPAPNYTKLTGKYFLAGMEVANLSPALAIELRLPPESLGVVISKVNHKSVAGRVLRRGDIILNMNGKPLKSVKALVHELEKVKLPLRISFRRGRKAFTLDQK